MNNSKKRLIALATSAAFCFSTATAIYAAPTTKTLKALFNGIKISYNGQIKTDEKEPFIVDNTTYVPLRMVAELVGKNVTWDGVNKQILITDNGPSSSDQAQQISTLTAQLAQKSLEIAQLKQEKAALEEQIKTLQSKQASTSDLDELEEQLMEDYEEYEDIEFDIQLSGNEDKITVKIRVDLDDFYKEWNKLSEKDIKNYIEDICDDIWDAFKDAKITGYIYDTDAKEDVVEFKSNSKQKLEFDFLENTDLADLEDDLNYDYKNYFSDIRLTIELDGDNKDIVYEVRVDYKEYGEEWDDLSDSQIKKLMSNIYDDIEDEFPNADIEGYVYTTSSKTKLAQYWRTSSGSDRFERFD